jgi:hypothetical protein
MLKVDEIWRAHPKQALLHACPVYEVMFGGAKGGGKTDGLLFDHVKQHGVVHDIWEQTGAKTRGRAIIIRKEFGRLKDFINRALMVFPVISKGQMRWNQQDHWLKCSCGYRLEFGHLEDPNAHNVYQGQEFTYLGIDQVEEIPWFQVAFLKLNVRTSEPALKPLLRVRYTANPGGVYGEWVRKRFIDPSPDGFKVLTEEIALDNGVVVKSDRCFIPSTVYDNPSLPPEYIAQLMLAPEYMRRAYLYGDWNVTEGAYFSDLWNPDIHVIDDLGPSLIRIPSNWPVFRAGDWGSRKPACCLWMAVDNDGNLIVLDELYGPGENGIEWARKIAKIEESWGWLSDRTVPGTTLRTSKLQGFLDPAAFSNRDNTSGLSVSDLCFEQGINWFPAENDRKTGWMEVRRRLAERGGISRKIPGLRVCRRCTNLIRTLPNLPGKKSDDGSMEDDVDTKSEDHAADTLRYGCMSRPLPRTESDVLNDEIAKWERINLMRQSLRGGTEDSRNKTTGY